MQNNGQKPLDVTILLVGADFSIAPLWPVDGADNRIAIGESRTIDLVQNVPDGAPASDQRLVLVTVPGVGKSHMAFDNLGQEGLRSGPDEDGEAAAARTLMAVGLNDMDRASDQPAAAHRRGDIYLDKTVLRWGMRAATGNGRPLGIGGPGTGTPHRSAFAVKGSETG